jgi:integrase
MAGLLKRGTKFYAIYRIGGREVRRSLETHSRQLAKEKLRQLESALARGEANPLPTKTPIAEVLDAYVAHIRAHKTPKSAQTEIYYLREAFGTVCETLKITSRKPSRKARKRPLKPGADKRRRVLPHIEVNCFEEITTAAVSDFITALVQARGLSPKTANHYRQILTRVCNWAMKERGIRMPADRNPAAAVKRYHEEAPDIRFLTLAQIEKQLNALTLWPQLQTMVAVYIYAGLRREEALWLQVEDIDLTTGTCGMIRLHAKTVAGEFWQPKTRRNRVVPISSALRAYLDRWTPPKSHHDWYFPSPEGRRWDADNFSQDLRAAQKKTKLPYACLDFRHTFGSQLAMKGESLYKISALMGNSPEICRRHYAALVPEAVADTVEFGQAPRDDSRRAETHAIEA